MVKHFVIISLALAFAWQLYGQDEYKLQYIEKYSKLAVQEMERAGVPASIKLAQGILESDAGQSTLAKKANNHFGIKCGPNWTGKTYEKEDDDYDENGNLIKSCFRVFKNVEACYVGHSEFLRDPNKQYRYGFLFRLDPTDYRGWANGLKTAGYATSPTYADKLIRVIETYELFKFDAITPADLDVGLAISGIMKINDVKVVFAEANETPAEIAIRTGVSLSRILSYNEGLQDPNENLLKDTRVFLQHKRNNFRGKKKYHYVQPLETMYAISQIYGLKLKKLYQKNRMEPGTQPAEGEKIKIRGWCKVKKDQVPKLRSEVTPVNPDDVNLEWDGDSDVEENESFDINFEDTNPPVIETPTSEPPVTNPVTALYHTVVKGDTLYGLARSYNTTVDTIKSLNNMASDVISVGQQLRVR